MNRIEKIVSIIAGVIGPYTNSIIDGINVTQVDTNGRTGASLRGNKLLVKWGPEASREDYRSHWLTKWVAWAKRRLEKKSVRVEQRQEWQRTIVNGYSVYDIEGKEEVARMLAQIERDVRPIVVEFDLPYRNIKESVAEGTLGFNRSSGGIIALNVRQKSNTAILRKYSAVMATMIHELAHVRHMNHGPLFRALEIELLTWARDRGIYRPF